MKVKIKRADVSLEVEHDTQKGYESTQLNFIEGIIKQFIKTYNETSLLPPSEDE